jgi:hypothetical protein
MPRTSKADASVSLDEPEIEGRYAELDGYTVAFETHKADMDPAPLFRGLPDDRCQCPHWGVVLSGRIIFRYPDHDEVYTAGDAYYGAPGHLPLLFAGTELVEFSPTGPLNESMAVIGKNLEAGQGLTWTTLPWTAPCARSARSWSPSWRRGRSPRDCSARTSSST